MQNFPGCHKGQGATEYLVLLAVVLIVALVSVALLGFFPGMASDAQATQSQIYWQSASPIAITEWGANARTLGGAEYTYPYIRVKNNGAYPIRITKVLGTGGQSISQFYCDSAICGTWSSRNISDYFYLAPGEETYFGAGYSGTQYFRLVRFLMETTCSPSGSYLCAASSICQNSTPWGKLVINKFGFEYIQYVEGQQITKRQIGTKPLTISCKDVYVG